jgi:dTDP-4-dehydrorhamnose 3,5-epimerase/reductase
MLDQRSILITGSNGQLGLALQELYPEAKVTTSKELDISDWGVVGSFDWTDISVIINAAAYTKVDEAETPQGRINAWSVNANGCANLSRIASEKNLVLLHISTDYVFDGTENLHIENEAYSPLGVYGQSKAAGDLCTSLTQKHYIVRSSWIVGSGPNFVRSIYSLGKKQISPSVVADQFGRLTFTSELARAIDHLLTKSVPYGTYNLSNGGDIVSWSDIARQVYADAGFDNLSVGDTTAAEYFAGKVSSPRPAHSGLDLTKIEATGFKPRDWRENLKEYLSKEAEL